MKKTYLIYLIIVIVITICFSILIIERSTKTLYKLIVPKFSEETGECPCKDIGKSSYCGSSFLQYSENPILRFELRSGSEQIYDGVGVCIPSTTVKINSYGFRDYEYSLEKSNKIFRIIVLGDSYTFGHGIELNETYSKVLEKLLNGRDDEWEYEVLNFGVPGYNVAEKVEVLAYKALKFNPDLIVFQYLSDDIVNWTEFRQIEKKKLQEYAKKINQNVNELTEMQKRIVHINIYEGYLGELENNSFDKTWEIVEKSFEKLASITQNKTVLLWVDTRELQSSRLNNICQKYGWYIMDKEKYMPEFPKDEKLIIHPKDPHPSALAHRLIAEEIYKKLIENKLLL